MTTTMQIGIDKSDLGWELTYAYNDGPAAFGADGSPVYRTRALAVIARNEEIAAARAWDRAGLADAPHLDAY